MSNRRTLSIGPELPDFGSWNWLGTWIVQVLSERFDVSTFCNIENPPDADVIIFLKFKPSVAQLARLSQRSRLVFIPVDIYGSAMEIDLDLESFRHLRLVILHTRRLGRYFAGVVEAVYMDHPLKYALPKIRMDAVDGPLIWIGKLCNLGSVIPTVTELARSQEISILTDIEQDKCRPQDVGLPENKNIRCAKWSPERHVEWTQSASAAIDVKGNDFRSRHKPPAKAMDFLASGVPVITNRGSSVDLHITELGLTPVYAPDCRDLRTPEIQRNVSDFATRFRPSLDESACETILHKIIDRLCSDII